MQQEPEIQVSKEQFAEWKEHPVTQQLFAIFEEEKAKIQFKLNSGHSLIKAEQDAGFTTENAIARIQALDLFLSIRYEEEKPAYGH